MQRFFRSLGFALNGLLQLIRYERNFQIQVAAFIGVLALGIFFGISSMEWVVIFLISALVMGLEAINTAIEHLCDLYSTEANERIKKIKDLAAGAVLIAAVFAVCIAVVMFLPYVKKIL
ncbi:MAG: diacylglycerol kinase family protein [Flavobacteriia bacterium]|jgi:diacylglycerol kinase